MVVSLSILEFQKLPKVNSTVLGPLEICHKGFVCYKFLRITQETPVLPFEKFRGTERGGEEVIFVGTLRK